MGLLALSEATAQPSKKEKTCRIPNLTKPKFTAVLALRGPAATGSNHSPHLSLVTIVMNVLPASCAGFLSALHSPERLSSLPDLELETKILQPLRTQLIPDPLPVRGHQAPVGSQSKERPLQWARGFSRDILMGLINLSQRGLCYAPITQTEDLTQQNTYIRRIIS